jgi:putative transposase
MTELSKRQRLYHVPPEWVRDTSLFFVTFCTVPRGHNQLCQPEVARALLQSVIYYHETTRWWARLFLLMPDHVHALLAFPSEESMANVIRMWKGYQTKQHGIKWQAGLFDHRLRSSESEGEKTEYIRQNPVRAGLVDVPDEWAFCWPR